MEYRPSPVYKEEPEETTFEDPNAANVPTEEQAVADIPAPPVEESSTEGSQAAATPTPEPSTDEEEEEEMVEYDGKMYPASDIEIVRNIFGQEVKYLKKDVAREEIRNKNEELDSGSAADQTRTSQTMYGENYLFKDVTAVTTAASKGVYDTTRDVLSMFTNGGVKLPESTKYEDEVLNATSLISGYVIPEIVGVGWMKRLGMAAHSRVGWNIGNSAFVRWLGNRGIEAGVTAAISGAKTETKDPGNAANVIRALLPKQLDFLTDDFATFDGQDPDYIRRKNTEMDVGLGFLAPLIVHLGKLRGAAKSAGRGLSTNADVVVDGLELTGNNPSSKAFLKDAAPVPREVGIERQRAAEIFESNPDRTSKFSDLSTEQQDELINFYKKEGRLTAPVINEDGAQALVDFAVKQEEALDELGRYNLSRVMPDDADVALKGVNDLFDYNEIGMRTVDDFGVVGAAIDQARIARNAGTSMGRIRNMISPAAMKYTVNNLDSVDDITLGLAKSLDDANDISVAGRGWSLTNDDILKSGENLVVDFFDPTLDVNGIRRMLGKQIRKMPDGTEVLQPGAYGDIFNQIVKMGKEFNSMDIARAQAYVGTSLAGQMSDVAEAARFSRTSQVAVQAAQEKILDNMKFLMRLKGSTNYYKGLSNSMESMWKTTGQVSKQTPEELATNYAKSMETLNREIDAFAVDMDYTFKNYPELGEAIMEMYEMSDGRVFSIDTVNNTMKRSLTWARPVTAMDKETPQLIGQAVRANWFNSALSALGTPLRAFYGNIGGIVDEPVSYFAGALIRGDMDSIKKGMYAYRAIGDIRTKAVPLMRNLYQKASQNMNTVVQSTDIDYVIKNDQKLESMKKLAAAERRRGNDGYAILLDEYIMLQEMAQDPILKFSSNLMTGMDGLPRSMIANAEARFRAIEKAADGASPEEVLKIANSEYDSMFDSSGLLKDKAAEYGADRISLRADTPLAQAFKSTVEKYPAMRFLLPFPGTQANIVNILDETIPAPFRSFQQDINELAYTPVKAFTDEPGKMRPILERKGYNVDAMSNEEQLGALLRLKNRTLGRKAVSTFLGLGFLGMFFSGRITGEGIYDKQAQKSRETNSGIPKNSIKGLDGKWYEYEKLLGPGYGGWVRTLVTVAENANYIGAGQYEGLVRKLMFSLGSVLEEDTGLSALTPLFDALEGNENSMNRWAAGQINSLGPLGGARNEAGNILNGGLRIVDGNLRDMLLNRNKALGLVSPEGDLPFIVNPLDGTVPNQFNPILRIWNSYGPVKVTPESSPNGLFLDDIGYSYSMMFKKREGVEVESEARGRLMELVAEDGQFNRDVTRIRRRAERLNVKERMEEARRNGADSETIPEFLSIQSDIRDAAKRAEELAYARLDYKYMKALRNRIEERQRKISQSRLGATEFIQQVPTR